MLKMKCFYYNYLVRKGIKLLKCCYLLHFLLGKGWEKVL